MIHNEKENYFNQIISENEKRIRHVIFYYSIDKHLSDDLYQEILYNIWESLDNFKGNSNISTWIYRIAMNISIFHNRNSQFQQTIPISSLPEFESFCIENNNEIIERLYVLIEKLNDLDKSLIFLYLENRSHKEIAEIMGISVTNVGTKMSRITQKLKQIKTESDNES